MRRCLAMVSTVLLTVPALHGCGEAGQKVLVVIGPWVNNNPSDDREEADVFERVLEQYEKKVNDDSSGPDLDIRYQSTRAIGQVLRAKIKDGTLPDIAIMPNVGELAGYATEDIAQPVTSLIGGTEAPGVPAGAVTVTPRALWRGSEAYAVAIKTDLKSLIIYDTGLGRVPKPSTFLDLDGITGGKRWCIGLSAPSAPAWPGTDWVEDHLLHQLGQAGYQKWAAGDLEWTDSSVRAAFAQLGKVSGTESGTVSERQHALFTKPEEARQELLRGDCAAMHQSSFYTDASSAVYPFPDPAGTGTVEVSGDFAARFTTNPAAEGLLTYLAGTDDWVLASDRVVLPVDPKPSLYQGARRAAAAILSPPGAPGPIRCPDASDSMPTAMATAFQSAVAEYVAYPDRLEDILRRLKEAQVTIPGDQRLRVECGR